MNTNNNKSKMRPRGSIAKRKENSYRVRVSYTDVQGKRQTINKTAPTPAEAKKLLTKTLGEVDKELYLKPSKIKVEDFLHQWLECTVKLEVADSTYELYRIMCDTHIIPAIGSIPLSQLRPEAINKLYIDKKAAGKRSRTVQLIHVTLHKALKNGVKAGLIATNPMDTINPPKIERRAMQTMTEADIKKFLDEVRRYDKTSNTHYYPLFYTSLFTAARRGELIGLRWSDVELNPKNPSISINRQETELHNLIIFKETKTAASRRLIDLTATNCAVLKAHRAKQNEEREFIGLPPGGDSDLVFSHVDGTPLLPNTVTHVWIKLRRRCHLEGVRLHDARHTHATLLLKSGISPKVIQERLGHASFSTTMNLYAHTTKGMGKAAATRFDEIMTESGEDHKITEQKPEGMVPEPVDK
jgi:integrase